VGCRAIEEDLFFSFCLLGRTYRTALQQMLKMSTTFLKASIHSYSVFRATLQSVSGSLMVTVCSVLSFSSTKSCGLFGKLLLLEKFPQKEVVVNTPCSHLRNW
jgi:hypothetical protein